MCYMSYDTCAQSKFTRLQRITKRTMLHREMKAHNSQIQVARRARNLRHICISR